MWSLGFIRQYPVRWSVVVILLGHLVLSQWLVAPGGAEWLHHSKEIVAHYQEHQALDPEASWGQFFRLHFGDLQDEHAEQHDHSDLPFQDDTLHLLAFGSPILAILLNDLTLPTCHIEQVLVPAVPACITRDLHRVIWQPPRQA